MGFQPGQNLYTQGFGSYPESVEVPFIANRAPTPQDYLYPIGKRWVYQGQLDTPGVGEYILVSFNNNSGVLTANWQDLQDSNDIEFITDLGTATSINGQFSITGINAVNPNIGQPLYVYATNTNQMYLKAQISGSIASADATKCGICAFNSSQFNVTTPTGFVSLLTAFTQINVLPFTTPGANTYTPTTGAKYCLVEVIGAGGGGGGASISSITPDTQTCGGGGGSGAYARGFFIPSSQTVTIGAGGTAGSSAGGNGGTGGTSSFGALISCTGGTGGVGLATTSFANSQAGGIGGSASGAGIVFSSNGNAGGIAFSLNTSVPNVFINVSGYGANSQYGNGGAPLQATTVIATAGNNGTNGAGASGGISNAGGGVAGGVGGNGIVIITEFLSV